MAARFNGEERLGVGEVLHRLLLIFSQQETSKYCNHCQQQVLAVRPGTSRLKNLTLTLLTCGVWTIFWIIDARRRPGWRCRQCDQMLK